MPRLLLVLALIFPVSAFADLDISEARIKNLPPTVPVRAGYMTIHNPEPGAVTIISVRSEAFASVEIHQSLMKDGMMHMEPVGELRIDAGASLQLAPGGFHLMMMQPVEPTHPGDEIEVFLQLDNGTEQGLIMKVIK
jgi:copper(I)-binding protein